MLFAERVKRLELLKQVPVQILRGNVITTRIHSDAEGLPEYFEPLAQEPFHTLSEQYSLI